MGNLSFSQAENPELIDLLRQDHRIGTNYSSTLDQSSESLIASFHKYNSFITFWRYLSFSALVSALSMCLLASFNIRWRSISASLKTRLRVRWSGWSGSFGDQG